MKNFREMGMGLATLGLVAASSGETLAKAPDTGTEQSAENLDLVDSGVYTSGDAATQEIITKLKKGEWRAVSDPTPPPISFIGDKSKIDQVLANQGLTLDRNNIAIISPDPQQSNNFSLRLIDRAGEVVAETDLVQISVVDNDEIRIATTNSDGSIDLIIYDDGKVKSTRHLIPNQ